MTPYGSIIDGLVDAFREHSSSALDASRFSGLARRGLTAAEELAQLLALADLVMRVAAPAAFDAMGIPHASDLRALAPISDTRTVLAAHFFAGAMPAHSAPADYENLREALRDMLVDSVWADGAVAAARGEKHPVAQLAERAARGASYSSPLDLAYAESAAHGAGVALVISLHHAPAVADAVNECLDRIVHARGAGT